MASFKKSDETVKNAVKAAEKNPLRVHEARDGFKLSRYALAVYDEGMFKGFTNTEHLNVEDKAAASIADVETYLESLGVKIDVVAAVNARLDGKYRNAAQYIKFPEYETMEEAAADVRIIPFSELKKDRETIATSFETFKTLYEKRTWYSAFTAELAELYVSGEANKEKINSLMLAYIKVNETETDTDSEAGEAVNG